VLLRLGRARRRGGQTATMVVAAEEVDAGLVEEGIGHAGVFPEKALVAAVRPAVEHGRDLGGAGAVLLRELGEHQPRLHLADAGQPVSEPVLGHGVVDAGERRQAGDPLRVPRDSPRGVRQAEREE